MKTGDLIRRYRCQQNMSQVELANKIEESKQTIYKYETGVVKKIPLEKIIKIAAALGIPTSFLLGDSASILELLAVDNGMNGVYDLLQSEKRDRQETDEKKAKLEKIFSAQTTSARVELSSREHRLVAAYRNAPDNIKAGVDAILEPFAEKTDVSVG